MPSSRSSSASQANVDRTEASSPQSSQMSPQTQESVETLPSTQKQQQRYKPTHAPALSPSNIPTSPDFGKNQHLSMDEEVKERFRQVVAEFSAPIRYAFAYGSGVFAQKGYDLENKPMVDFIFGVSHPSHWHYLNLQNRPGDYSFLGKLGSSTVSFVNNKLGAGVYFNPYVKINGMTLKYGVVSIDTLCQDLLDWRTLYLSGRMHKPIKILRDDARVRLANQVNLTSALRVALLRQGDSFTEEELWDGIVGISYRGDFRMHVGENPNKIKNIIASQTPQLRRLYAPLVSDMPNVAYVTPDGSDSPILAQDMHPKYRGLMVKKLPPNLRTRLVARYRISGEPGAKAFEGMSDQEAAMGDRIYQAVAGHPDLGQWIDDSCRDIIGGPALTQSIKGVLTAGVVKSTKYAGEKLSKWWSARK
ncbi:hypothetical protein BZG36_01358 [Bifiguratus adelaidae]|uniref:Phosphatidate cytidylyltransferase, mitochondrial n=1 Tax=Bifiguratus adelaidae TaxID=1938954 RepID=A0A261Y3B7_9FUNG|nr:hypothetical protein BZG36_01358 [Bifiguratus adelaidae]